MQNTQYFNRYVALIIFCVWIGACTKSNESFEEAMDASQEISRVPRIQGGLPFFTAHTLTPIWNLEKGPVVELPSFSLTDQNGAAVTKQDFEGKVTVVGFIFTSCAGFCPMLIDKLKSVEGSLQHKDLQIVVFSVDPEVDTPEVLKVFAKSKGIDKKNWRLVTGDKKSIYSLVKDTFASEVRRIEQANMRKFAHTEHFYLLDQDTRLRGVLNGTRLDLTQSSSKMMSQLVDTQAE